jgi:transposase
MRCMTFDEIKTHYGSVAKARDALGLKSRQTIYDWQKRGVPSGWQARIELLTDGKLKADENSLRAA